MKLTINVTQDNIDNAIPSTKCHCPIALAIVDSAAAHIGVLKQYIHASVDHDGGRIHHGGDVYKFRLPDSAMIFIQDRDDKKKVAPFAFSINAVI